jgi:hypothetical protein
LTLSTRSLPPSDTNSARGEAEQAGLAAIAAAVAQAGDGDRYCLQMAKKIDYRGFDLEVRTDILPILMHLFPERYTPHR